MTEIEASLADPIAAAAILRVLVPAQAISGTSWPRRSCVVAATAGQRPTIPPRYSACE